MDAAAFIDEYLQWCEDSEIDRAQRRLSDPCRLQFPGGITYTSLRDMASAPKRYRWVRKHRDRYLVTDDRTDVTVTSIGRLYGEWRDGSTFAEIRYIDVFTLRDGLITEQLVWNDLGDHAPP